jgi:hypothetical protein
MEYRAEDGSMTPDFYYWTSGVLTFFLVIFTIFLYLANDKSATANQRLADLQEQFNDLSQKMAKTNEDIAWFTGSMESHSALMMRLEAKRQNVAVCWWDPERADPPSREHQKHGDSAELREIYLYVDREFRGYAEGT